MTATSDQPLVLLHAYPLNSRMWQEVIPLLTPELRPICLDLPGFGQAPPLAPTAPLGAFTDAVVAALDAQRLQRAAFCGVSMGGYLLFDLWRRYPDRVQALLFCDTRAEADTDETRQSRTASIEQIDRGQRAPLIDGLLPKLVAPARQQDRTLLQRLGEMAHEASDAGLQSALWAMRGRPDSRSLLPAIDVPTLVLVGSEDSLTPPQAARTIHQGIRGSQLVELPEAGHLSPLERPELFATAVRRFFVG